MQHEITVSKQGKRFFCGEEQTLMDALLSHDVFVDNPCSGKGVCGKCKVRILSGEVTQVTETEKQFLSDAEIEKGTRLSCLTRILSNVEVKPLQKEREHKVLTSGHMPQFERDHFDGGYGLAVDIGTTTVVMSLVDLCSGQELASASQINAQKHYGLDVLTRITYEYEHPETGILELQNAIVSSLNDMILEVCQKAQAVKEKIFRIHVAANCTMTHMLLGVDARSIGKSPYRPAFLEAKELPAHSIGLDLPEEAILYCLPHVSAYIGGDIVAGAYVCQLKKETGNVLFIDIGTNGEIVLAIGGRLISCSCAAGPALEGMNISSGMRAAVGAIEELDITEDGVFLKTIGNVKPVGLCGSGILAAVRELLQTGIVKKNGAFIKLDSLSEDDYRRPMLRMNGTKREFVLPTEPELLVTQGDVRQVQLAKGAILSGFVTLLNAAGIETEALDKVVVAGQFGAHLSVDSLVGTGIIPADLGDRLEYVGNSSKTGAYMTLMSQAARAEMEALAREIEYLELAETDNYDRIFMNCATFPDVDKTSIDLIKRRPYL